MGWFSKDIMGGDPAWDCVSTILEMCGVINDDDSNVEPIDQLDKDMLEKNQFAISAFFSRKNDENKNIGLQVFGNIMMRKGAAIHEVVRDQIHKAIVDDKWSKEDPERRILMWYALENFNSYDNTTPTDTLPVLNTKIGCEKEYANDVIALLRNYYKTNTKVKFISVGIVTGNQYGVVILADSEYDNWSSDIPKSILNMSIVIITTDDFNFILETKE